MSKSLGMPLVAGGLLDQPAGLLTQVLYLDRVYTVVKAWAAGKRLDKEDADLIMRLTQLGFMS